MLVLRSLLYFLTLLVSTLVFSLLLVLLGWAMPFHTRSVIANLWGMTNMKFLGWICDLHYQVRGWENIPGGACIYMAKHQSAWETIALRGLLKPDQTWVLKRELLWIPAFGWALAICEPIAIDRKSGRQAVRRVVKKGTERLQQGRSVIIFPEGTRVAPGQHKRYGIGGALLAEHSGFPIVPIAHNAGVFWSRRGLKKYPGTIQVVIGSAIETHGLRAPEINRLVEDWIESEVKTLPHSPDIS